MRTTFWDTEERSVVNLREAGSYVYSIDPTTTPLCLFFAIGDGEPQRWKPGDRVPAVFFEIGANPKEWQLVAHNYEFERNIYDNILVPRYGFPSIPLEVHHCTQRLALTNAYPAELDRLAQALALPYRKDPPRGGHCWRCRVPSSSAAAMPLRCGTKTRPSCNWSTSAASLTSSRRVRCGNRRS
jgi:hypothetical protein